MSLRPETRNQNSFAEPNLQRNNTKQQQVHHIRPSAELFQGIKPGVACDTSIHPVQCVSGALVMIIHHASPPASHHLLAATQRTFSLQPERQRAREEAWDGFHVGVGREEKQTVDTSRNYTVTCRGRQRGETARGGRRRRERWDTRRGEDRWREKTSGGNQMSAENWEDGKVEGAIK